MNEGNRLLNLRTISRLSVAPGDDILERGMGNGSFMPAILSLAPQVHYTGCYYPPGMVWQALACNQAAVELGQARFLAGEAGSLPFPEGQSDKVLTVNTIYFWEQPEAVLAGLYRVLKPAGTLLTGLRPKAIMQHYPFVSYGFRLYDADEITRLLSRLASE
jgi:ubiquinone/menaquinone biosynthesis C-methylase UbiE